MTEIYYSKSTPELRKICESHLDQRWKQLNILSNSYADNAIKFLTLTNGGGIVTVVSFMGINSQNIEMLKFPLMAFMCGIMFVGFLLVIMNLSIEKLLTGWIRDTKDFYLDQISYTKLINNDEERLPSSKITIGAGILSFISFISGIVISLYKIM